MEVPEGSCPQDKSPAGNKNSPNPLLTHPPYDYAAARLVKNLSYTKRLCFKQSVCTYRDNLYLWRDFFPGTLFEQFSYAGLKTTY